MTESRLRALRLSILLITAVGGLAWSVPARAQGQELGENCEIERARVLTSNQMFTGQRVTRLGRPVVVCRDGVQVQSDSAVHYHQPGRTEFMGAFRYSDPERELRADSADYFEERGQLFARGSVQLLPRDGSSEVRGDSLTLFEGAEGPEDDQVVVHGEPASAVLTPAEPAADGAGSTPYRVTARRIRFEGSRYVYADGEVEVDRDSLHATSASLVFDQTAGLLTLSGTARMQTGETDLVGSTIEMRLPNDDLEAITVQGEGRLQNEDLELLGDEIRIVFADDEIQQLVAVHRGVPPTTDPQAAGGLGGGQFPQDGGGAPGGPSPEQTVPAPEGADDADPEARPQAWTETFVLTADSLHIQTPEGVLDTVFAVGRARGESRDPDTEAPREERLEAGGSVVPGVADQPESDSISAPDSQLLRRDWIEGDTIIATFTAAEAVEPEAVPDPGVSDGDPATADSQPAYRLDRLVAAGNARTLYRSPPEDRGARGAARPARPSDRSLWAISYVLADRIALTMTGGNVEHAEAEGNVTGYHGEPAETPEQPDQTDDPADPDQTDDLDDPDAIVRREEPR